MPISAVETVRVFLAAVVLLAPGILLVRPFFGEGRPRGAAGLALGAGLGVGAYGLFLWVMARLHVALSAAIAIWIAMAAFSVLALWLRGRRRAAAAPAAADGAAGEAPGLAADGALGLAEDFPGRGFALSRTPGRVLAATCVAAALIAPAFGAYSGSTVDAWDYLNRATAILRADRLDAPNPYSPEFHNPYDPTFYGLIASVARVSGVEPARLWQAFPVFATPVEIGVIAAVTALIVGSAAAGTAAAVIYTLIYGPFFLFKNSGHHQMLGDLPYLAALAALFLFWRSGRWRYIVLGALAAVAAVTYHHFFLVQTAFTIGIAGLALLFYSLTNREFAARARRAVIFVATVAVALLPFALFIHFAYLSKLDPKAMNASFTEGLAPLVHFGRLYMPDPFRWYFIFLWHPLPAILAMLYLAARYRRDPRAGTLAVLVAAPLLVVLDPLLFPVAARVTSVQVATRLLNLTTYPSVIVLGWAAAEWLTARRRAALVLAGLSIAAILPQTLMLLQSDYAPWSVRNERENSPAGWADGLAELGRQAKPGQTVLADPVTSYSIPSFAPLAIVADQRDDFAFQAPDPRERLSAADAVLDPLSPPDSTAAALMAYRVDWIVVNRRIANPLTVEKLDFLAGAGQGIRRAFERGELVVYAVNRPALSDIAALPPPALYDHVLIAPSTFAALSAPGTGLSFDHPRGVGAVIGPDTAAVGDTIYVTLYYEWRPGDPPPSANAYAKLLREGAYGSRGRWLARQVRKSILGRLDSVLFPRPLEYRDVRTRPLPPGSVFADMFAIQVPPGTTPGRYGLYLNEGAMPTEGKTGIRLGGIDIRSSE